jgi:hypothetical protein
LDIGRFVVEYARGHRDSASYPVELRREELQEMLYLG